MTMDWGITNADTPSSSQKAADAVAEEVVDLVDPLYFSMVEAVPVAAVKMTQRDAQQWETSNFSWGGWKPAAIGFECV